MQNNYTLIPFSGNVSIPQKKIFVEAERLFNICAILKRKLSNKIKNSGNQEKILAFYNKFIKIRQSHLLPDQGKRVISMSKMDFNV